MHLFLQWRCLAAATFHPDCKRVRSGEERDHRAARRPSDSCSFLPSHFTCGEAVRSMEHIFQVSRGELLQLIEQNRISQIIYKASICQNWSAPPTFIHPILRRSIWPLPSYFLPCLMSEKFGFLFACLSGIHALFRALSSGTNQVVVNLMISTW